MRQSIVWSKKIRLDDVEKFLGRSGGLRRFLVRLQAKGREFSIDKFSCSASGEYPQPVFIVHYQIQILAKRAHFITDALRPEHLRLNEVPPLPPDVPKVENFVVTFDRTDAFIHFRPELIDDPAAPVPEIDVGILAIRIGNAPESAVQVVIVAVDVSDDVASCALQTLVDRVRLTTILLANPVRQTAFVLPNEIDCPIRASTVDDDVFQVCVSLAEYRTDRLLDERRLVERGSDNRDFRQRYGHVMGVRP